MDFRKGQQVISASPVIPVVLFTWSRLQMTAQRFEMIQKGDGLRQVVSQPVWLY